MHWHGKLYLMILGSWDQLSADSSAVASLDRTATANRSGASLNATGTTIGSWFMPGQLSRAEQPSRKFVPEHFYHKFYALYPCLLRKPDQSVQQTQRGIDQQQCGASFRGNGLGGFRRNRGGPSVRCRAHVHSH